MAPNRMPDAAWYHPPWRRARARKEQTPRCGRSGRPGARAGRAPLAMDCGWRQVALGVLCVPPRLILLGARQSNLLDWLLPFAEPTNGRRPAATPESSTPLHGGRGSWVCKVHKGKWGMRLAIGGWLLERRVVEMRGGFWHTTPTNGAREPARIQLGSEVAPPPESGTSGT
jgi:hypothetical protein